MTRLMLGAYWDARPDSLEKCTYNVGRLFVRLAEIDPLLARWYEPGRSRKDTLERRIDTSDMQRLRSLLLNGRHRRDVDDKIIDDLGFSLNSWNGADKEEEESSVDIHCGCYNERLGNNVLIDLPCKLGSLRWVENVSALLAFVAETWRPKWAGIMSKKAMRERDFDGDYPFVDWMVYVPRPISAVPLPSRVEVVKGGGSIVVVQPEPPVGNDAEELSRIRRVERLLRI